VRRSCLDPSRAGRELGWTAEIDVAAGIAQTLESLRASVS
jgi:nucleoside-diphosphate-sugar epimerase